MRSYVVLSIPIGWCDVVVQAVYAQKGPFTKLIATEGFSTVLGQLMSPLKHTKSTKSRKFGNIVKMRLENDNIPYYPHVK